MSLNIVYARIPLNEIEKVTEALFIGCSQRADYVFTGSQNSVNWIGSKPGGNHHGTLNVAEGKINTSANSIISGSDEIVENHHTN